MHIFLYVLILFITIIILLPKNLRYIVTHTIRETGMGQAYSQVFPPPAKLTGENLPDQSGKVSVIMLHILNRRALQYQMSL